MKMYQNVYFVDQKEDRTGPSDTVHIYVYSNDACTFDHVHNNIYRLRPTYTQPTSAMLT